MLLSIWPVSPRQEQGLTAKLLNLQESSKPNTIQQREYSQNIWSVKSGKSLCHFYLVKSNKNFTDHQAFALFSGPREDGKCCRSLWNRRRSTKLDLKSKNHFEKPQKTWCATSSKIIRHSETHKRAENPRPLRSADWYMSIWLLYGCKNKDQMVFSRHLYNVKIVMLDKPSDHFQNLVHNLNSP